MKNQLIVWSKDRACQLDLLFRSLKLGGVIFDKISVIYKASNKNFQDGYNKLSVLTGCSNDISWIQEIENTNFYNLTLNAIDDDINNVFFSTDDTYIYRNIPSEIPRINRGVCFSLRLGLNTIVQNCFTGELQLPLNKYVTNGDIITWNPHNYNPISNYGYCFGLDMCGYNTLQIKEIIRHIKFKNSNEFESALFKFRNDITQISSFKQSIAVNIPINNISGVTQSVDNSLSTEKLNELYLQGKRLEVEECQVNACHQAIPYKVR